MNRKLLLLILLGFVSLLPPLLAAEPTPALPIAKLQVVGPAAISPGGIALLTTTDSQGVAFAWSRPEAVAGRLIRVVLEGSTEKAALFVAGEKQGRVTIVFVAATADLQIDVASVELTIGKAPDPVPINPSPRQR